MSRKTGFTMIELLVVIAIIAILAAIIFPVFSRAKESAYRAGDLSNMNAIRNGLQLYRADQGAYPPAILGYASRYLAGPQLGQVIPADNLRAALYPKRIDSISTMRPAFDRYDNKLLVAAVWPHADSRGPGSAPAKDLNGDGIIDANDDPVDSRQAYDGTISGNPIYFCDPTEAASRSVDCATSNPFSITDQSLATQLYGISGYDIGEVRQAPVGSSNRWELRYTLRWTNRAMSGGNRQDDPRQLIYNEPPDDTVITWDSWFRDYDNNNIPLREKKDFVLFLNGTARPYDSRDVADRSWRVQP